MKICLANSILHHIGMKHNSEADLLTKGNSMNNWEDEVKSFFEDDHELERFINEVLNAKAERVLKENTIRDRRRHEEWFIRKQLDTPSSFYVFSLIDTKFKNVKRKSESCGKQLDT